MGGTIVVSGKPGAGSSTIAKMIAEHLNYDYFSPGKLFKSIGQGTLLKQPYYPIFRQVAEELGLEVEAESKNETSESGSARSVWNTELGRSSNLHEVIDETQKRLAERGSVVIDGKLSIRMLEGLADLSVWVDTNDEDRTKRTIKRDGISYDAALQNITRRADLERENWKRIYGFDYFEQEKDAMLCINSSKFNEVELCYHLTLHCRNFLLFW